jgi:transposase
MKSRRSIWIAMRPCRGGHAMQFWNDTRFARARSRVFRAVMAHETLQTSEVVLMPSLGQQHTLAAAGLRFRSTPDCVAKPSLCRCGNRDSVSIITAIRGSGPMMGQREVGPGQFFYAFDLDRVVPPDHLVRQIDVVLDLSWVHKELAPYYSHTGRPSIDPVLMIRMLIIGYVFAIRSERAICAELKVNLAYRWFCKLSIEDNIPDHSVFSRARHERFRESDALRRVFESVVAKCIELGLVGGEGFSIDASLIKADVDKKKRAPGDQSIAWPKAEDASRAVREYLKALDAARNGEEDKGVDNGGASGGANRRKPPKEVSLTDPQAAWVARPGIDPLNRAGSSSTPRAREPVVRRRSPSRRPCWSASSAVLMCGLNGWRVTVLMARPGC